MGQGTNANMLQDDEVGLVGVGDEEGAYGDRDSRFLM